MFLRVRHNGKQPRKMAPQPPALRSPTSEAVAAAIRAEDMAADGLLGLPIESRKMNVHYTHTRTHNPKDVQPQQMTREQFWEHICRCFREVYPRADTTTGSILEFGAVAKELHKDSSREEDCSQGLLPNSWGRVCCVSCATRVAHPMPRPSQGLRCSLRVAGQVAVKP